MPVRPLYAAAAGRRTARVPQLTVDVLRALPYIVAIGGAPLAVVAILLGTGHIAAAWVVVAVAVLIGVAMARTGTAAWRPKCRSATVRRISRRAAVILPLAGIALATLMAGIAVKPVLLGLLGIFVGYPLVAGLVALGGHELLHALRRAVASRRTEA